MIEQVMQAWIWPPGATAIPIDSGLINHTVGIELQGRLYMVLQHLNTSIFAPEVHHDIDAITRHLAGKGLLTPRLVPTQHGELWHTDPEGGCWRLLSPVGTRTLTRLSSPAEAEAAGACVGRFHTALADLDHTFVFSRPGAHDTNKHFADLRMALITHGSHRFAPAVNQLADTLLDAWDAWSGPTELPTRILHGDLKISNLRFEDERAVALIDLDTLHRGTLDIELGDAMRSWCNPIGEDVAQAQFQIELFKGAMQGYLSTAAPTIAEREAIGPGIERICLELAARFARDALEESYFGFDPHIGHAKHNLLRARGQTSLAASVHSQQPAIEAVLTGS